MSSPLLNIYLFILRQVHKAWAESSQFFAQISREESIVQLLILFYSEILLAGPLQSTYLLALLSSNILLDWPH